jgi:hypothetical protein
VLSSTGSGDLPQAGIGLPATGSGRLQSGTITARLFVSLVALLAGAGSWALYEAVIAASAHTRGGREERSRGR